MIFEIKIPKNRSVFVVGTGRVLTLSISARLGPGTTAPPPNCPPEPVEPIVDPGSDLPPEQEDPPPPHSILAPQAVILLNGFCFGAWG